MAREQVQQDRGFAWVIMALTTLTNMIEASVFMSPAVYLVAWDNAFSVSKAQLGLAGALLSGMACTAGVFVGPVIAKLGCRPPCLVGTVICALGLVASALATSIEWLYVTYGCLAGLGCGVLGVPPIICVQYYFKKKRPFALGTSLAGHSLGTFVFLPVLQYLIHSHGWRGAMLLHAGLVLQILILASFFRPVHVTADEDSAVTSSPPQTTGTASLNATTHADQDNNFVKSPHSQQDSFRFLQRKYTNPDSQQESDQFLQTKNTNSKDVSVQSNGDKRDIKEQNGGCQNRLSPTVTPDHQHETLKEKTTKTKTRCFGSIAKIWNFWLLKEKALLVFIFNMFVVELSCGVFFKFTPLRARDESGISEQRAALLVSLAAMAELSTRIIGSVISNLPKVNRSVLTGCAVLGVAVMSCVSCSASSFTTYAACSALFGTCIGFYFSTVITLLTDIVGVQHVAHGFSLLNLFLSFNFFTAAPLAGFIFDISHSYDLAFYIYGVLACIPGVLFICMPCVFPQLRVNTAANSQPSPNGKENGVENGTSTKRTFLQSTDLVQSVFRSSSSLNVPS